MGDGSADGAARTREGYLFLKKRYPSLRPTQRKLHCKLAVRRSAAPGEWESLRGGIASLAAMVGAKRFASASIIRCRSADLASVQTNHLLPMAQQRGERSNAALVGTCKADNIQSRRRLRKANESQAERQRIIEATQIVLQQHLAGTRFRRLRTPSSTRLPMRGSRGTPLAFLWGI